MRFVTMLALLQCPKENMRRGKGKRKLKKWMCRSTSNHRANPPLTFRGALRWL